MGIKKYTPYTPSRRNMTGLDFTEITKNAPEKSLTVSLKKNSGRNNQGKITVRHHGGGSRRKYRIIDFKRNKDNIPATVLSIEYDPNRTANIALICYADGQKAYILAPQGLKVGQKIMNGEHAEARLGNCLPLSLIPIGTEVHNVELYPGAGAQMVRASISGTSTASNGANTPRSFTVSFLWICSKIDQSICSKRSLSAAFCSGVLRSMLALMYTCFSSSQIFMKSFSCFLLFYLSF